MNLKHITTGALMLPLLLVLSCKKELSKTQSPVAKNNEQRVAANETVTIWMTTADQSKKLQQQANKNFAADAGTNATTVTVDPNTSYQGIDGFGFTLTQGSAKVISEMATTQQNNLLNDLFSSGGIGISIIRIGIGATDLSEWSYSYRDGASFSLSGPDLTYLIPMIKKIRAINSNIKILATPWTAPMWMKSNGSFTGGTLKAEHYESYGQYWVDYLNAMKAQGIPIWAVTPQNEPLNGNNDPSMILTKENELGLINSFIGPKIRAAGFNCKIIAYDHNCDNTDFPIYVANNSSYVDGTAFHLYAGNISALTTVKNATNKNIYFTEQYTGANGSFSGDLMWHTTNVVIGSARNWSRTALEWNLATNTSYGPHTAGGCTDCKGAITVNNSTTYTRNVGYYIIAHASKFVKAGAVRINSNISGSIQNVAYRNPDGSRVLLAANSGGSSVTFKVKWGSQSFTYTLPAGAVGTFKW